MSLHLWEAVHDAEVRSDPLFEVDPSTVESTPPSLQRVLLAAAFLWCQSLVWPTVREISSTAGVAASTSIHAVGSSARLRIVLVESEAWTILHRAEELCDRELSRSCSLEAAITGRVDRLAAIEPVLARLPAVVGLVIGSNPLTSVGLDALAQCVTEPPVPSSEVA